MEDFRRVYDWHSPATDLVAICERTLNNKLKDKKIEEPIKYYQI